MNLKLVLACAFLVSGCGPVENAIFVSAVDSKAKVPVDLKKAAAEASTKAEGNRQIEAKRKASVEAATRKEEAEFEKELGSFPKFAESHDLVGFEKQADTTLKKWRPRSKERWLELVRQICSVLNSNSFSDDDSNNKRFVLAEKYAMLGLAEKDLPLMYETDFVISLSHDPYTRGEVKGEAWAKVRTQRALIWLRPWKRIEQGINRNFDPNNMDNWPMVNLPLPPGVSGSSGISPDAIKDPKLRAQYKADIEKNRQKAQYIGNQIDLHHLEQSYFSIAQRYLINIYTHGPSNLEELKRYLDAYVSDEKRKIQIINAVTERMKRAEQADKQKADAAKQK